MIKAPVLTNENGITAAENLITPFENLALFFGNKLSNKVLAVN